MRHEDHRKAAERLRELASDPVAAAFLVGYLLDAVHPDFYVDLVEAALIYRERFGAVGNDSDAGCVATVDHLSKCARCLAGVADAAVLAIRLGPYK